MKTRIVACLVFASAMAAMLPGVAVAGFDYPVAAAPAFRGAPSASGERAVWAEQPMVGDWNLFVRNFATNKTTQITTESHSQKEPAIGGDRVVWADDRNGNWDIYMRDLPTKVNSRVTKSAYSQRNPDISGTRVIWEEAHGSLNYVKMKDVSTGRVTLVTMNGRHSAIAGTRIAYAGSDGTKVYVYNAATKSATQIALAEDTVTGLDISGKWVVWSEDSGGTSHVVRVRAHDLIAHTTKTLRTLSAMGGDPLSIDGVSANGTLLAYATGQEGPSYEMYIYDTQLNLELTVTDNAGTAPALANDRLLFLSRSPMPQVWYHWLYKPNLTVTGPSSAAKYSRVTLTGTARFRRTSTPLAGSALKVQRSYDGWKWATLTTVSTSASGAYSYKTPRITQRQYFRFVYPGGPGGETFSAMSPAHAVRLR